MHPLQRRRVPLSGISVIHIFDVDNTVIKKSSAWYFLREALAEGIINWKQIRQLPAEWLRYKLGRPNLDFIETAVTHLGAIQISALEETAKRCFNRRIKPNIYPRAEMLINELLAGGEKVYFATSSLSVLIKPLEKFLGITGTFASELEVSDGRTTGRLTGSSLFGAGKKVFVEKWLNDNNIDPNDCSFYSDSYTDLPLLEFCGKAIVVNPDRILIKEAKKRGWERLRFRLGDKYE